MAPKKKKERKRRPYPPAWLSPKAKQYFGNALDEYGDLTPEQLELLAMVSHEYTIYVACAEELQQISQSNQSIVKSEQYKLQKEALANYLRLRRQLRQAGEPTKKKNIGDVAGGTLEI